MYIQYIYTIYIYIYIYNTNTTNRPDLAYMAFCIGINRVKDAIEEISLRQLDPEASELSVSLFSPLWVCF
jgi:hypothetical protein